MRLLNVKSQALHEFTEETAPSYAILSHTWGEDEVTLHDIQHGPYSSLKSKAGWNKILNCCRQALEDGIGYIWVDTCCIDKSSSSELQEAINSMFRWYEMSSECYVHLVDYTTGKISGYPPEPGRVWTVEQLPGTVEVNMFQKPAPLSGARWFTRGWTLQELLAPNSVRFFDASWIEFGDKTSMSKEISRISGVSERILKGSTIAARQALDSVSVAQRMSWAARRTTTRIEDLAYCLLGIFDINMPLLYGEGSKAFLRLQEEIIKFSDDQSILAWGLHRENASLWGVSSALARSPADFAGCSDVVSWGTASPGDSFVMTQRGLKLTLPIAASVNGGDLLYCVLSCTTTGLTSGGVGRVLVQKLMRSLTRADRRPPASDEYYWLSARVPVWMDERQLASAPRASVYLPRFFKHGDPTRPRLYLAIDLNLDSLHLPPGFFIAGTYPPEISKNELLNMSQEQGIVMIHFASQAKHDGFVLVADCSRNINPLPDDPAPSQVTNIIDDVIEGRSQPFTKTDLATMIRTIIANELGIDRNELSDGQDLEEIGMDSLTSLSISGEIREKLEVDFQSDIFFGSKTIRDIIDKLRFATRPNIKSGLQWSSAGALVSPPRVTIRGKPSFAMVNIRDNESLIDLVVNEGRWKGLCHTQQAPWAIFPLQLEGGEWELAAKLDPVADKSHLSVKFRKVVIPEDKTGTVLPTNLHVLEADSLEGYPRKKKRV